MDHAALFQQRREQIATIEGSGGWAQRGAALRSGSIHRHLPGSAQLAGLSPDRVIYVEADSGVNVFWARP